MIDGAPLLPSTHFHGGAGIVVIENAGDINDVIAVNYAYAIGADVALIPAVDREETQDLSRKLSMWSKDNSHFEFGELKKKISKQLKGINFEDYRFATFFTTGFPYGFFIRNKPPSTHVLKDVNCGAFISNNLIEEFDPMSFGSADTCE